MPLLDPGSSPIAEPPAGRPTRSSAWRPAVWSWLLLAVVAVLALCFLVALHRLSNQVARLSQQSKDLSDRLAGIEHHSEAAAQQATQAAASAQAAAHERDQAEVARAQSQTVAQQAQQAAAVANQHAALAEQKAEQYRQQREQELSRLQQVLGQITETRRTTLGLVMTLGSNSIRFDFDKADIKPQYREILSRIAGVLMTLKGYSIYVYGYTDDIGTQEYNLRLSERRARSVRDYLVTAGLDPKIMTTRGFGKSDPRVRGDSSSARASNRRVEIGIVDSTLHFEGSLPPASP